MHASKGKHLWRQEKRAAMGLDKGDLDDVVSSQEGPVAVPDAKPPGDHMDCGERARSKKAKQEETK